jgi:hypothetical protein
MGTSQIDALSIQQFELRKRAHSPQLAAGLASVSENGKLPYGRRSLQLAAGIFKSCQFCDSKGSVK